MNRIIKIDGKVTIEDQTMVGLRFRPGKVNLYKVCHTINQLLLV